MKYKTTRKAIKDMYRTIIKVGDCRLQHLLIYAEPFAYITRKEGWAADVYELAPGVALVTGYAPFGNIEIGWDICRRYEEKARKILHGGYQEQPERLRKLMDEFIEEVER